MADHCGAHFEVRITGLDFNFGRSIPRELNKCKAERANPCGTIIALRMHPPPPNGKGIDQNCDVQQNKCYMTETS